MARPSIESHASLETTASTLIHAALFDWLIIAFCWGMLSASKNSLLDLTATVVIAGRFVALGTVLHDACHRRLKQKTIQWWLVEALAGWPISSTTHAMRYHHLRHHQLVGTPFDPYRTPRIAGHIVGQPWLTIRGLILPIWWTLRPIVGVCAVVFPSFRPLYAKAFLQDRKPKDFTQDSEVYACARAEWPQLLAHSVVLTVALSFSLPLLSHVVFPLLIAGMLNAYRVSVEHLGVDDSSHIHSNIQDYTVSHPAGWIGRAFIYPHNLWCHVAHHLYPTVGFSHLPDIEKQIHP